MSELVMVEPFRSEFIGLLRNGAGSRDVQDTQDGPFARQVLGDDRMIARELDRVRLHRESLCALLEAHVGPAATVLDVGCGTGGTTVALGTSRILGTRRIVGADADPAAVSAAVARARACGLFGRLSFEVTPAHEALPFETGSFDLTVCVSVLEFISDARARRAFVGELCRVTAPNGYVALFTPNPLRPFDYHTHRLLGDYRRTPGYPWASTPRQLRAMFRGCHVRFLHGEQLEHVLRRRGLRGKRLLRHVPLVGFLLPWQKLIAHKPA